MERDPIKQEKLEAMIEFKVQSVKKAIQFLASVSIMFLLTQVRQWFPVILHFGCEFSSMATSILEEYSKWVAILGCNLIFIILLKDSGFFDSPSCREGSFKFDEESSCGMGHCSHAEGTSLELDYCEAIAVVHVDSLALEDDADDDYYDDDGDEDDDNDRERGDENAQLVLAIGELNKECDVFIEKMKRQMRMENLQLVIFKQL